ncbi:unnamed protein product [Withania somnifera]
MNSPAVCRVPPCCYSRLQPLLSSPAVTPWKYVATHFLRFAIRNKGSIVCRLSETESEPDKNDDKDKKLDGEADGLNLNDSVADYSLELNSRPHQDKDQPLGMLENTSLENNNGAQMNEQSGVEDGTEVQVASGSPLPGVKPQQLDESIRIPKETVEILRDQIFGFDTFFVTSHEPYEGGVLFKGNLRGQAAKTYKKVSKRMQDKFGDDYKLFLLINPEDDKPVAVVVPRMTLQPESTALPEWFAAGTFGLVTVFTLLLRNVPALQSNLLSVFDNLDLLKDGLPGALITAFLLGAHEVSHRLVAAEVGIKLGIPYFVPSWQASARLSALSIGLLGISSLFNDVAFYWVVLIFFLQRGPIAPLSEEISDPDKKYMALGVVVLLLGVLVCLPYPFPFSNEAATGF